MIAWIEDNLTGNPTATMGRPIAVVADHSIASWLLQMAVIAGAASLLITAIAEALF